MIYDRMRAVADELLFPGYRDYISFGALSHDGAGCRYYGSVHLVVEDFAICERATVFEENSLLFCYRNALGVRRDVPPGTRAEWKDRDLLAACKHAGSLRPGMTAEHRRGLLIDRPDDPDADFIEVHIYDRLNCWSIREVGLVPGGDEDDEIIKEWIARDCVRKNIPCRKIA